MTAAEILELWAKFTEYDPEQTRFNLLSAEYQFHKAGEVISTLAKGYDPYGIVSAMYAKKTFLEVMGKAQFNVLNLLKNPDGLDDIKEMWRVFTSDEMSAIENGFLAKINAFLESASGKTMLTGDVDESQESLILDILMDSVGRVAENLTKCKVNLFQCGGEFRPVTKLNTHVHIFNKMAECLVALHSADDGAYICFIANDGTADAYFSFMLKSNGNILSVSDRVDEAYISQHGNTRTNRWLEEKSGDLFPYKIVSADDFDYKGYARSLTIDDTCLDILRLGPDTYLPVLLAVVMLSSKYTTEQVSHLPQTYTVDLLKQNLKPLNSTALVLPADSLVIRVHQNFTVDFSKEEVLSGAAGRRLDEDQQYKRFINDNQIMVDLWGEGFDYDEDQLLRSNRKILLASHGDSSTSSRPAPEFVGDYYRLQVEAYHGVRHRLAAYMRQRIKEEYIRFGGYQKLKEWKESMIRSQKERLLELAAKAIFIAQNNGYVETSKNQASSLEEFIRMANHSFLLEANSYDLPEYFGYKRHTVLNRLRDTKFTGKGSDYACEITGSACSIFIKFRPYDWQEEEMLLGCELPKLLKGWKKRRGYYGNPLLSVCDPVEVVGTPVERDEREFYRNAFLAQRGDTFGEDEFTGPLEMSVIVGFSKRGLARMFKQLGL